MAAFIALTIVSVAALFLRQSSLRYKEATAAAAPSAYLSWLRRRGKELGSKESFSRASSVLKNWAATRYPGPLRWIFIALTASLLYQAASGFFFGLFIRRGMFGLPLLAHVGSGGLFAVSLAAMMFWRARDYGFGRTGTASYAGLACPVFKSLSRGDLAKFAFWAFAFFGFVQTASALGSMLPVFTFQAQMALIEIHRYGALALLLSVILFADLVFLPPPRKYGDTSLNSGN